MKVRATLRLTGLIALLSALQPLTAANAQMYMGSGRATCPQYLDRVATDPVMATAIEQWIAGYVSGMNFIWKAVKGTDRLLRSSVDEASAYVRYYCEANKHKNVVGAANAYFSSLPK